MTIWIFNNDMALTNSDINSIRNLINQTVEEKAADLLATKDDIKHLLTKDDFYSKTDEVMGSSTRFGKK